MGTRGQGRPEPGKAVQGQGRGPGWDSGWPGVGHKWDRAGQGG